MALFDVFNGDADGICALQQFRLANPAASTLVTGVKRDISLLKRVTAGAGDEVNVFDISLDKNREPLLRLLDAGVRVRYFDHHFAGDVITHPNLESNINLASNTCTSLIVNRLLAGKYAAWSVVGAFGDNLDDAARAAAAPLDLDEVRLMRLRELGIYINYNGYGATVEDLFFAPDILYRRLQPYADPFIFIMEEADVFTTLRDGAAQDLARAHATSPERQSEHYAVYVFPAEPWARRVSGAFGNELATASPRRAHALLTRLPEGGYLVSVRAPLSNKTGADELCRQFATGGGRKAAAGINQLPENEYDRFVQAFMAMYGC